MDGPFRGIVRRASGRGRIPAESALCRSVARIPRDGSNSSSRKTARRRREPERSIRHSVTAAPPLPPGVQAYLEAIVRTCADGGSALVSLVIFGSAATGGFVGTVSDVDLLV